MTKDFIKEFYSQKGSIFWSVIIVLLIIAALFANFISQYDPSSIDLSKKYQSPSKEHIFGTDKLGRDMFSRTVHGARISLSIGFLSRSIAIIIGVLLGMTAGYFGGFTDILISRFIDSTLAFPSLLLAIGIALFLGPGYLTVLISLTVVSWAPIARLVRSSVLNIKSELYIEASKSINAGHLRIMFKHILPNCQSIIIVAFTSGIASAIIGESSLSFLGLGPDPSIPTWGQMISSGLKDVFAPPPNHPWLYFFPGIFLISTILSLNIMGDLLRDILDPRLRGKR